MLHLTITIDVETPKALQEAVKEVLEAIASGYTDGAKIDDNKAYFFTLERNEEVKRAA